MTLDQLNSIEQDAREQAKALQKSGFRDTHATFPPCRADGPLLVEAIINGVSFEFGLATGNKRIGEI